MTPTETVPGVNASGTASLRILADTPAGTTRMQMALTTRSSKTICESACNKSYGVRISNQDGTRALQRTDKVKALDCRDVCTQVHAPYTIMNDPLGQFSPAKPPPVINVELFQDGQCGVHLSEKRFFYCTCCDANHYIGK